MAGMIERRDLQALADERLLEQYQDSVNLRAFIAALVAEVTLLQDAAWSLLEGFDVEDATGWALDVVGLIVGLPRPFYDANLVGFFGYLGAPGALGYSADATPTVGGVYLSASSSALGNIKMSDGDYRKHIKAKIVRNRCSAFPDEILEIINLVIDEPGAATTVDQSGSANMLVTIARSLSISEKLLLSIDELNGVGDRLLPRSLGVSVELEDLDGPF